MRVSLALADQDETVTGFHQLLHHRFAREQCVGDDDESQPETFLDESRKQPLERVLLAVLLVVAVFLDDGLGGDRQNLLHVRMRNHGAQNGMSIPSLPISLNALQAMFATHLGRRVIAGAVHHQRHEIVEFRHSKRVEEAIPPQPPESRAQGSMNVLGIDFVDASSQRRIGGRALDAEQIPQIGDQLLVLMAGRVELKHRWKFEREDRQRAHQAVASRKARGPVAIAGLDSLECLRRERQHLSDDGGFRSFLGHARPPWRSRSAKC